MTGVELVRWQWMGYPRYHQSRLNLLIHVVLVPMFVAGNITLVVAVVSRSWSAGVAGIVATALSIGLQGRGHRSEVVPPEPFSSAGNAAARIFLEQWVTFPRFVLSGGWWRAIRGSAA